MKLIIALLLAIGISVAQAEEFYATTKAGGEVRLSFGKCKERGKDWFVSYIIGPSNQAVYGCWILIGDNIHTVWDDGDKRIYPANAFKHVPGTEPKKGNSI